jgi:hypothetical protein
MEHKLSKVKVYQSTEYGSFHMVDGNRPINKNKIAKIIKEIQAGNDVLDESPILVTEHKNKLLIKDGQHRFQVSRELKRPVHYIIHKRDMSLYNVAKVNSNTEKWTAENFVNAYAKAGNEHYLQLQKFHKKYGFSIGLCVKMLTVGIQRSKPDGSLTERFEQGLFVVKAYKEAVLFAEHCKNFEAFPAWKSQAFVTAIGRILATGLADMGVLVKKFNNYKSRLLMQNNTKDYLNNLAEIYNIDNSKQRPIY